MEFPSVLHSAAASRFAQLKASQRRYRLDARGMPLPPGQEAPRPGPEAVRRAGPDLGETYRNDFARSYREGLSGQVFFVTHPGYFMTPSGAPFNHGSPWEYDSRVPLVFYGPGQVRSGVI
jgi:hypothetical protein